ncbi:DUF3606 domain-containing protein [Mesorhizobium japonicum]|nr:DUF3606 domain-containing protein [Mesorhizobium japonicum]
MFPERATKSKSTKQDQARWPRPRPSADEDYEVRHFANKVGLTVQQVRDLIKQRGNDGKRPERV